MKCAIQIIGNIDIESEKQENRYNNITSIDDFITDKQTNNISDNINFYHKIREAINDMYLINKEHNINDINKYLEIQKDCWFLQYTKSKPILIPKNKNKK